MARVLVIEDDQPDGQKILAALTVVLYSLGEARHEVQVAPTGREGLLRARQRPDIILLDVMLPDVPGTSICKMLKENPRTESIPVIIVSARGEEIDRIVGFEVGADDYVVKPFSVRELLLRMEAVMRRSQVSPPSRLATFGSLRLDREAHRVWVDRDEVLLTALEFRLLVTLCERQDHVYSRDALLSGVWDLRLDPDSRAVDTVVKRLRTKLGAAGKYIVAVRGAGYKFSAEPER